MSRRLPTPDQYNDAVQNPKAVFTDGILKLARVATNGLGLPEPSSGGFALTYQFSVGAKKYAVRVFHKESRDLEARYPAIHATLKQLQSPYFIDFTFLPGGIRIGGISHPIVRMDWVDGATLGSFLEDNFEDSAAINSLRSQMQSVGALLESRKIAHGDLQTGNIIISAGKVKLIDYDGMYVPGMTVASGELGHRHFQHPERCERHFNERIDRFSLILLDFSFEAVVRNPSWYRKFSTTGDNILFTASDFREPSSSSVFQVLFADQALRAKAERFAALCQTPFDQIPTLGTFSAGTWTPSVTLARRETESVETYQGAYPVVLGSETEVAFSHVGDYVEFVGLVTDVAEKFTKYRRPYRFVNFTDWRGRAAKITIWSDGLECLARGNLNPDNWPGKWISVTGLMTPPYPAAGIYSHTGITISDRTQVRFIDKEEAEFRLGRIKRVRKVVAAQIRPTPPLSNKRLLERLPDRQGIDVPISRPAPKPVPAPTLTSNQKLLEQLKQRQQVAPPHHPSRAAPPQAVVPPTRPSTNPAPPVRPQPVKASPEPRSYSWLVWTLIFLGIAAIFFFRR